MIVLDTSAIMAVLLSESASGKIIQIMSDNDLCISAGTLSELLIVATARNLELELRDLLVIIDAEIRAVDEAIAYGVQEAFKLWGKGQHPASLNFGDCFAYATAMLLDMPLLYVGDDFSKTDVANVL